MDLKREIRSRRGREGWSLGCDEARQLHVRHPSLGLASYAISSASSVFIEQLLTSNDGTDL